MSNLPYKLPDNTPDKAPLPQFNPERANYFDMFAPHFYNLDTVQALMKEGGGPLLKQVAQVTVEYIYNPERGEDSGEWKPVIHFVDGGPSLVVNQTRAKVLMNATKSIHVNEWSRVSWLEIAAGIENGQAQLIIHPADPPTAGIQPGTGDNGETEPVDKLNDELFS